MNRFKSAAVNLAAMLRLGILVLCITFVPAGLVQAQSSGTSNEAQLDAIDLKEYVGSYGPRKILFASGMLQYN